MSEIDKQSLGECRSVTITCISEAGWRDPERMQADVKGSGGPEASQWDKVWQPDNGAGSASLVEVEGLDGSRRKFLIDCGWDEAYMRQRFQDTGVAGMLERGEIDFLFLSHEHLDHLWGLQAILHHRRDLPLRVPSTLSETAYSFIRGERPSPTRARDAGPLLPHTGPIHATAADSPVVLYPGCVAVAFDVPILLGIRGEQSLFFRIRDRGTVCVTGCCHQTVTALADYALSHVADEPSLYGLYGGLHIAPFGPLTPEQEKMVADLHRFGFRKIAANHCTGAAAVEKMVELGYPVVRSTGPGGTVGSPVLGNGETVAFG
ncbi:MAG: MBL fold metallo-hydrolase [Alphaproteobacteria bacterium]